MLAEKKGRLSLTSTLPPTSCRAPSIGSPVCKKKAAPESGPFNHELHVSLALRVDGEVVCVVLGRPSVVIAISRRRLISVGIVINRGSFVRVSGRVGITRISIPVVAVVVG